MRGTIIMTLTGLVVIAGCTSNPRYAEYKAEREVVLAGKVERESQVIPIALPAQAPTPAEISGRGPAEVRVIRQAAPPPPKGAVTSGPYPGTVPVLTRFANEVKNDPGTRVWSRPAGGNPAAAAQACGRYASTDAAQTAFLAQGGPAADRLGLDPDGDGFVCGWDPRPRRL